MSNADFLTVDDGSNCITNAGDYSDPAIGDATTYSGIDYPPNKNAYTIANTGTDGDAGIVGDTNNNPDHTTRD